MSPATISHSRRLVRRSYERSSSGPTPAKRAESLDPYPKIVDMGPRNGVPATQASRGAPRGDGPSRRNNADRIPSPFHFSNSPSRSLGAFCARGLQLCFANPNQGVGGAPRNVRMLARHPCGTPSCVKDARERAYDAACQALARRLASHDAANCCRK